MLKKAKCGKCGEGGKTEKVGRIIVREIFLFRNTFGTGCYSKVNQSASKKIWEDRESRNNCSRDFFVPEYFWNEMLLKGKPEHLKKNLLKNLA